MLKLLVGLGNPGTDYAKTRHNAGAWLVQALADRYTVNLQLKKKLFGHIAQITVAEQSCCLFLPNTYMNLSGQAVAAAANYYALLPEQILIAHDELYLPVGIARLKFAGGHGGHNGLQDIFAKLTSRDFYRLRIGIDKPANKQQNTANYVLQMPAKAEQVVIDAAIDKAIAVLPLLVKGSIGMAMQALHTGTGMDDKVS